MVNKDCYDRWDKICNTDTVLYHMSRLTLRVEYTKLHYYRLRFVHVTVWKNLYQNVELIFFCTDMHWGYGGACETWGFYQITEIWNGYDLRDLVLTPDQIRLRLIENKKC